MLSIFSKGNSCSSFSGDILVVTGAQQLCYILLVWMCIPFCSKGVPRASPRERCKIAIFLLAKFKAETQAWCTAIEAYLSLFAVSTYHSQ